jgi:hypothetical protein
MHDTSYTVRVHTVLFVLVVDGNHKILLVVGVDGNTDGSKDMTPHTIIIIFNNIVS